MGARKLIPAFCILGLGSIGVILAFILKTLYDRGLYVTMFSTIGISLTGAMLSIIILFVLIGVVVGIWLS